MCMHYIDTSYNKIVYANHLSRALDYDKIYNL